MTRRAVLIGFSILLMGLPVVSWAANLPAKVYENGANDAPIPQAGVKVEVFGGAGLKALLSSALTGADGGCTLDVPLGKEVLVKLTKPGYFPQYDIKAYSEAEIEGGVAFWIGSEDRVKALYSSLGETFNAGRGQVYLEIDDEFSGEGIEGVQIAASSGKVFDLGRGEYLIANAEGSSLKVGISKPGYAFDIEAATVPLFRAGMTQYYIKVQSDGGVYGSPQAISGVTSAIVSGLIKTTSGAPVSGASVAFTFRKGGQAAPTVTTNSQGHYSQRVPTRQYIKVIPTKTGFRFKPANRAFTMPSKDKVLKDFKAIPQ
jgi:hypothetical protein